MRRPERWGSTWRWRPPSPTGESAAVTLETASGAAYGAFLLAVFDEWVRNDVGRVFVPLFDVTLAGWSG